MRWSRVTATAMWLVASACQRAPMRVHQDLAKGPTTLGPLPSLFALASPIPVDDDSDGVCVYPETSYILTERWAWRTPEGQDARLATEVELTDGSSVTLSSPTSTGHNICLHTRVDGPLSAPVQRVRVRTSTPVKVMRIVWESAGR